MEVVINNWKEDGGKEAMDDWSGITLDSSSYICSLAHKLCM